eukprot:m.64327 g.64327  ORF g.64327 m.64327 type:complete len:81 (+) comp12006_c0_seq1:445-687(+)
MSCTLHVTAEFMNMNDELKPLTQVHARFTAVQTLAGNNEVLQWVAKGCLLIGAQSRSVKTVLNVALPFVHVEQVHPVTRC